jgi:hypothetical protein
MKIKIIALVSLLILPGVVFAQKKKNQPADSTVKKEAAADSVKRTVDSGKRKADSLKQVKEYDSVKTELVQYKKFYTYINTKFFPERFRNIEVERAIALGDSLTEAKNSKWNNIQSLSKSRIDSLSYLLKTADTLRMENQTFKALLTSLIGENVFPLNEAELKGTWQVYVQPLKVIGSGQESGIVSLERLALPDSLNKSAIKQIVFLEEDLADIHFIGGRRTKVFYKVNGFSREKTYSISLQKGSEINAKLFVTPVPRGLQVSYKIGKTPGQYMFGHMRK